MVFAVLIFNILVKLLIRFRLRKLLFCQGFSWKLFKYDDESNDILLNFESKILFRDIIEELDDEEFMCKLDDFCVGKFDNYKIWLYKTLEDVSMFKDVNEAVDSNLDLYELDCRDKLVENLLSSGYYRKYVVPKYWNHTILDLTVDDLKEILLRYVL